MTPKDKQIVSELVQAIANSANRMYSEWNSNEAISIIDISSIEAKVGKLNRMLTQ